MAKCYDLLKKLLKMGILLIPFFLIVFFSFTSEISAAYFRYSDFDFDAFAKQNLGYWTYVCSDNSVSEKELKDCQEKIIASQKKFYVRLYKLLAKYQSKGMYIDDKIIIMTSFFELDPNMFADDPSYYQGVTNTNGVPYTGDDSDDVYDIDNDYSAEYWENETDTIKLLLKAMVGYKAYCYGIYPASTKENEDGSVSYVCDGGGVLVGDHCEELVRTSDIGFWEKIMIKTGAKSFFGIEAEEEQKCIDEVKSNPKYNSHKITASDTREVTVNKYWEFLIKGDYFDKKPHLSNHYYKILEATGHKRNIEITDSEKENHEEELKEARTEIVDMIKELLDSYGNDDYMVNFVSGVGGGSFWWPIGSAETTEEGGIFFASGEPVNSVITSYFGLRTDPVTGESSAGHGGIDIGPVGYSAGTVNVIASRDGIVTNVTTGCVSYGDKSCGGGYGNHIILSHSDGTFTIYAHLHENTITISNGQSVRQGQVIGKVGSSGKSTGNHLHFEVRTDINTKVDPLNYVDISNPRPAASLASSDIIDFIIGFEGGDSDNSSYIVICPSNDIPTVGHGITLKNNLDLFAKYGIILSSSNDYYNYCGQTMPKDIVDKILYDRIEIDKASISSYLVSKGLNLADYQLDALISLKYNHGNINGFVDAYQSYGATDALCTNWWNDYAVNKGTNSEAGLRKRRKQECQLFVHGY